MEVLPGEAEEGLMDFNELFLSKKPDFAKSKKPPRAPTTSPTKPAAGETAPRVVLQQYASTPMLQFGEVTPRTCVKRTLVVANESGRTQRVEVKSLESKDAMRFYPASMEVPAQGQKELTLTWTPGTATVLSKRLELKWNQSNSVYAELRGTCSRARTAPVVAPVKVVVDVPRRPPLSPSNGRPPSSRSQGFDAAAVPPRAPAPLAWADGWLESGREESEESDPSTEEAQRPLTAEQSEPNSWSTAPAVPAPTESGGETGLESGGEALLDFTELFQSKPPVVLAGGFAGPPTAAPPAKPKPGVLAPKPVAAPREQEAAEVLPPAARRTIGCCQKALPPAAAHKLPAPPPKPPVAAPGRRLRLQKPAAADEPPADAAEAAALAAAGAAAGQPCGGMFFDEAWREKRVHGLTGWLNHVLADSGGAAPQAMDAGERQRLSLRELEQARREAGLRHKVARLLRSVPLSAGLCRLEEQVHEGIVCISPNKDLIADVGQRANLLNLLCCYNPLWLRLAAEAVSGEAAPPQSLDDAHALRRYLDRRVFAAPTYAPPAAAGRHPELAAQQATKESRLLAHRQLLRRTLSIIVLLDAAKRARVLASDPCLFRPEASLKSSRDMAQTFCRDYMSGGVGDLNKHLGILGLKLSYVQTALDEYNFCVTSIAVELKDGARLSRALELLHHKGERVITPKLRLPAESLVNKRRNVTIALGAAAAAGVRLDGAAGQAERQGADPMASRVKAVVESHRDGTLELLWRFARDLAIPALAPRAALLRETARARLLAQQAGRPPLHDGPAAAAGGLLVTPLVCGAADGAEQLLLRWAAAVCWVYGRPLANLGAALRDGAALCLLVHHYLPLQLPLSAALLDAEPPPPAAGGEKEEGTPASRDAALGRKRLGAYVEAAGAIGGVPLLMTPADCDGCGPDERMATLMLAYLFGRVSELTQDAMAARLLQGAWLGYKRGLGPRQRLQRALRAARVQRAWRGAKQARVARRQRGLKLALTRAVRARQALRALRTARAACMVLQVGWRRLVAVREARRRAAAAAACALRLRVQAAVIALQRAARGRAQRMLLLRARVACLAIQAAARRNRAMASLEAARAATTAVQAAWRGFACWRAHAATVRSAVAVQAAARRAAAMRRAAALRAARTVAAAVTIQAGWRGAACRVALSVAMQAATKMEAAARALPCRRTLRKAREAAVLLQAVVRGAACVRTLVRQTQAAKTLQAAARMARFRASFSAAVAAAVVLQAGWRGVALRVRLVVQHGAATVIEAAARALPCRRALCEAREAVVALQAAVRGASARREYVATLDSIVKVQAVVRRCLAFKAAHVLRSARLATRTLRASKLVQSAWRGLQGRRVLSAAVHAAVAVQAAARGQLALQRYAQQLRAASRLQSHARRLQACHTVARERSARTVQAHARRVVQQAKYGELRACARAVQASWRALLALRQQRIATCAAVVLQAAFRGVAAVRTYAHVRRLLVRLQAGARRRLAQHEVQRLRAERRAAMQRAAAATALQCAVRRLAAQRHLATLQAFARAGALAMLHAKAMLLQAFTRRRQALARRHRAATRVAATHRRNAAVRRLALVWFLIRRLQARVRARRTRARMYRRCPELEGVAKRAIKAHANALANPALWLCNRTNSALETLLTSKNLAAVMRAVASLEMFTLIARPVCERMVAEGAVPAIYEVISTCNRSEPHQKVVGLALRTLRNLAAHPSLLGALWCDPTTGAVDEAAQSGGGGGGGAARPRAPGAKAAPPAQGLEGGSAGIPRVLSSATTAIAAFKLTEVRSSAKLAAAKLSPKADADANASTPRAAPLAGSGGVALLVEVMHDYREKNRALMLDAALLLEQLLLHGPPEWRLEVASQLPGCAARVAITFKMLEKKDKEQKKNEANTSAAVRQLGPKSFAAKQAAGPKAGAAKQLGPKAGAAKGALPPMRKFEGPSAFAVLKRLQDALTK